MGDCFCPGARPAAFRADWGGASVLGGPFSPGPRMAAFKVRASDSLHCSSGPGANLSSFLGTDSLKFLGNSDTLELPLRGPRPAPSRAPAPRGGLSCHLLDSGLPPLIVCIFHARIFRLLCFPRVFILGKKSRYNGISVTNDHRIAILGMTCASQSSMKLFLYADGII